MKNLKVAIFFALLTLSNHIADVHGQDLGFRGIGARFSIVDPEGLGMALGIGGHINLGRVLQQVELVPNFEYWTKSGHSSYSINADARYYFPRSKNIDFFLGGGPLLRFVDSDNRFSEGETDFGMNLLGGGEFFLSKKVLANTALKYVISDGNVLKITGGFTFLLGK